MSADEEETLAESEEDLLVDDFPEGLIHDLVSSPNHPAAKRPCMDSGAGPANFNSPSTSSDSALAQPAQSPMLPAAVAAPSLPLQSPVPSLAATAAASNAPALCTAAYAAVASGANPAPALRASFFASPALGGSSRDLRRVRTAVATPILLPLRRCVTPSSTVLLLPPPRMAAWVPANPTFNLPLPTPLAPLTPLPAPAAPPSPCLHPRHPPLPDSTPFPGPPCRRAPTHSPAFPTPPLPLCSLQPLHANPPPPKDAQPLPPSYPHLPPLQRLSSHGLSRGRAPCPPLCWHEDAPLPLSHPPVSNCTLPCSPHILTPSSPFLSPDSPPLLSPYPQSRLPPPPVILFTPHPLRNPTATVPSALTGPPDPHQGSPLCQQPPPPGLSHIALKQAAPPPSGLFSPPAWASKHPRPFPAPSPPPCTALPPLPTSPLGPPPLGPHPHLPHLPHSPDSPCPPYSCTSVHPLAPPAPPLLPPTAPSLAGNLLGNHAALTAFRNDPGLLYIGLDDWVKYWTCTPCDFTYGAALDSAMEHIQSDLHATRVKASAHRRQGRLWPLARTHPAAAEGSGGCLPSRPSLAQRPMHLGTQA
ncbi:unnamed protein product [Closterium sp. Naga37s-1]|nr:unnamed protein product [Closterium sp. Naga37s-1]